MKKILCLAICASMLFLTACQAEETVVEESSAEETTENTTENTTIVIGQVTDIVGNSITLQLVDTEAMSETSGQMSGGMMSGEFSEGEIPEGLEEGELPEGMEIPEGLEEGELPEGMEIPEGLEEGELPEGMEEGEFAGRTEMSEGEIPEGLEEGELPEGMEIPEGMEEGELAEGMTGGMSGNFGSGMMSSGSYELLEETVDYTIPVGATVYSFGSEITFSDITEESFISLTLNESGTIIEVNVLG